MARNGVIELSYARSAGTGDQPVPGTITSRRNSSRQERVQLQRQRQLEEERLRKQRLEQEAVARILTQKWEEEDRRRSRRRKRLEDQDDREDAGEGAGPGLGPGPGPERKPGGAGKHLRRFKEDLPHEDGDEALGEDPEESRVARGEWVSVGLPADERSSSEPPAPRDVGGGTGTGTGTGTGSTRHRTAPSGAGPSTSRASREAQSQSGPWEAEENRSAATSSALASEVLTSRAAAPATGSSSVPPQRSRSVVPGVFGLSDSEEEAADMKREMERAARSRRQRMSLHAEAQARAAEAQRVPATTRAVQTTTGQASTSARTPPDLCTQLMKVAEWKRSCGGKRLPMPEEMKLEVAKAMGAQV